MTQENQADLTVHIVDHPLVQHKLTLMRQKETGTKDFRELLEEIAMLMAYEITRDLPLEDVEIETPVAPCRVKKLAGKKLGIVPILRAGLGMAEGVLRLIPAARVGHIGLYRDPDTLQPVEYFCKLPGDIGERMFIVVDPMLATGGSSAAALDLLKKRARRASCSSVSSLRRKVCAPSMQRIPTSPSTSPPSMTASTNTATSSPAWATPATASSARCKPARTSALQVS